MFTLRTSITDLNSWVENKYLLIFEINEEALHIEGGAKTCRSKWVPLLHNDWRWKKRHRCASNKISRPLFIISLNPLPLRGKLSAVDFPDLSAPPDSLCRAAWRVYRGESRIGWRSSFHSTPMVHGLYQGETVRKYPPKLLKFLIKSLLFRK
jgi:hypothetical protein